MIKKLLLTLSFIVLTTIAFSGTTYAAQEGEKIVITEELSNLNKLYMEGVITEEEFSKAKSILLNPDSGTTKKKKKTVLFKKPKLTAAERRQLENELIEAEQALKEQLRAEKRAEREKIKQASLEEQERIKAEEKAEEAARKAERERIKQASLAEKKRITEEREKACADDPKSKGCKTAKLKLTKILEKIKIKSLEQKEKVLEQKEKVKEEMALEKQAFEEKRKRIAKQKELEKQASLEEQKRIRVEKAARKAERKRLKAEWKKACSEDPESKACLEGKPSEKIKKSLLKIKKKLGG